MIKGLFLSQISSPTIFAMNSLEILIRTNLYTPLVPAWIEKYLSSRRLKEL